MRTYKVTRFSPEGTKFVMAVKAASEFAANQVADKHMVQPLFADLKAGRSMAEICRGGKTLYGKLRDDKPWLTLSFTTVTGYDGSLRCNVALNRLTHPKSSSTIGYSDNFPADMPAGVPLLIALVTSILPDACDRAFRCPEDLKLITDEITRLQPLYGERAEKWIYG